MPPSRLSKDEQEYVRRVYVLDPTLTVSKLAQDYGVSTSSMLRTLKGVTRRRGGRELPVSTEAIVSLKDQGLTWAEISRQTGLAPRTLRMRMEKHNQTTNQGNRSN